MKKRFQIAVGLTAALLIVAAGHHARADGVAIMAMSPHMDMTVKAPMQPGDQTRADAIIAAGKAVMEKYRDVNVAQADGFQQFMPQLKTPEAHFTNYAYAKEAWLGHFDPMQPTSLMYKRTPDGWQIEGVMYTAGPTATESELNGDAPLSIAQWHRHVNVCTGPPGSGTRDYFGPQARFGLQGSIHTQADCQAAGGTFKSQIYAWMLHVWPRETSADRIWALHPGQSNDGNDAMHMSR